MDAEELKVMGELEAVLLEVRAIAAGLLDERDTLQAQVRRLRADLTDAIGVIEENEGAFVSTALAETPAQSVAHIEVAVLRRAADHIRKTFGDCSAVVHWLRTKADRLERGEVNVTVCTECVRPHESHRSACPYCLERDA
jgi:hypothetical protein